MAARGFYDMTKAPQLDDNIATKVASIAAKDSPIMQLARTEGLKSANSRGMLNSSMGIGAAQDAVLRVAVPMGAQASSQAHQKNMQARDSGLQEHIARMNLDSSDRNTAAQFLVNMESLYGDMERSIDANPNLSAAARAARLQSAKNLRDKRLNLAEQMWNIDLRW